MGGGLESCKDVLVMVGLQCIYAGFSPFSKAAFEDGLNPVILIVYRQALATLVMAPLAFVARKKSGSSLWLEAKTLALIFAAAFFGITANQITYYGGIYFSSATIASALLNLITAVTFLMAVIVGLERVNVWSLRGAAKILGTTVCIVGAVAMSLLNGPTLGLRAEYNNWLLGCLLVFASCWCWSAYLILQVHVTKKCTDHLYSTSLICFFGLVQSTVIAMFFERQVQDWKLNTVVEYAACIYSGLASSVSFFIQAWIVSRRGPVFPAVFYPFGTVIVAIIGSIFLHEEIYLGSLLGAVAVMVGLYTVLWGKASDNNLKDNGNDLQEALLSPHQKSNQEEESRSRRQLSP